MRRIFFISTLILLTVLLLVIPLQKVNAAGSVGGADMIALMNGWRASYWSNSLIEIQALDSCAQATAEEMARIGAGDHLANLGYPTASSRCAAYGFSGRVTENWAKDWNMSIDLLASYWSDYSHMLPATDQQYCYVGVGIADGYYILQAGTSSDGQCSAAYVGSSSTTANDATTYPTEDTSNYVPPVITSTPDYDGNIKHVVQNGQTLYTIATYYGVGYETIKELNKMTTNEIFVGDVLLISMKPTPTITLTRTATVMIPTRTPTQTAVPSTPRPTRTVTPTPDPDGGKAIKVDRPTMGFGLLVVSAAGFFMVLFFMFLKPLFKKK